GGGAPTAGGAAQKTAGAPPLRARDRRGKAAGHCPADDDGATPARRGKRNRHLLDRTRQPSGNDTPPARASEGSSRYYKIPLFRYFVGEREPFFARSIGNLCS